MSNIIRRKRGGSNRWRFKTSERAEVSCWHRADNSVTLELDLRWTIKRAGHIRVTNLAQLLTRSSDNR